MSSIHRNIDRPSVMDIIMQNGLDNMWDFCLNLFFSHIDILGHENIPQYGPAIFVANHNNQFIDGLLLAACAAEGGREVQFIIAEKSYNRHMIGWFARQMKCIPVARAQDNVVTATGTITGEGAKITGNGTQFTKELHSGDSIKVGKELYKVKVVHTDTSMEFDTPLASPLTAPSTFKISKHLDHNKLYNEVYNLFRRGGSLGIFPEGGSHDNFQMLPLKPGVGIMALGAMAKYPKLNVPIIPVGLNYYGEAYKFRGRVVVQFGPPLEIDPALVASYRDGTKEQRFAATNQLMAQIKDAMEGVVVSNPNYETLLLVHTIRRVYIPAKRHITREEYHRLNRHFSKAVEKTNDWPEFQQLRVELLSYRNDLKLGGLSDREVIKMSLASENRKRDSLLLLLARLLMIFTYGVLGFPGFVLMFPMSALTNMIARKKKEEALAGSDVKQKGLDVVATWKILTMLVLVPISLVLYCLVFGLALASYTQYSLFSWRIFLAMVVFGVALSNYGSWCVTIWDELARATRTIKPLYLRIKGGGKYALQWVERRQELQEKVKDWIGKAGLEVWGKDFADLRVIKPEDWLKFEVIPRSI